MDHELIPVRGTPLLFLLDALGEYFDNSSVHDFCRLLKSTGSWILGSFALMAVTESTRWKAGDVDIFVDHASPKSVAAIAMLTNFLVQKGLSLTWGTLVTEHSSKSLLSIPGLGSLLLLKSKSSLIRVRPSIHSPFVLSSSLTSRAAVVPSTG